MDSGALFRSAISSRTFDADAGRGRVSIAFVATCPPRQCGIATFTSDLAHSIAAQDADVSLAWAAIDEPVPVHQYGSQVGWRIRQGDAASYRAAAMELNASDVDVVAVQHEFGLYGTWDGPEFNDHLLPFLEAVKKPVVTTLHTVLPDPSESMRRAVQRIGERSFGVVTMAQTARGLLIDRYGVCGDRVHVIPHGAPPMPPIDPEKAKAALGVAGRTVIATFGLVDPRKGLEYAIKAMQSVAARHPEAVYLILGRTHPDLVRAAGEAYRSELVSLVESLGLTDHVRFVDRYLSQDEIVAHLRAADVYVTPYLDPKQITSGTLAYALAAGRAIVSTRYLHAAEALANERGILVDFHRADELAAGINAILDDPDLRARLERNAYDYGRHTAWPLVARRTVALYRAAAATMSGRRALSGRPSYHAGNVRRVAGALLPLPERAHPVAKPGLDPHI